MTIGIYKITNPSNKIYIGLSLNIEKRWEHYKYACNARAQKLLYYSIKKYGFISHKLEIIEICDEELLGEREIFWIKHYNSYRMYNENGLNLTEGGNFPPKQTKPKSDEHKRKIGLAQKGKIISEEVKNKIREARKKQVISQEAYARAAEKRKGKPSKLKGRKRPNISEKLKGRKSSISIPCSLVNLLTGEIICAGSIQELSRITKISVTSLLIMRSGKIVNKYRNYKYKQNK